MSRTRYPECRAIEPDLIAVAAGEGTDTAGRAVQTHVAACCHCRRELERYQAVEGLVAGLRQAPVRGTDPMLARAELEDRLADLRSRLVRFGVFSSPLGPILIARSELGVSLIEYLDTAPGPATARRIARLDGPEAIEDARETEAFFRELLDFIEGRRTQLDWPLDLRRVRGDFQQRVLQATARLPYGAVTSYAGIARGIGAPRATRAVAQALRHNPVPIVIPCHRVIGSSGNLVGYAGNKVGLKRRLLEVEGVPTVARDHETRITRQAMYVRYQADAAYCLPTCGSLSEMPLAELTLFGSRARAEAAGLTPCADCRPDLHPIRSGEASPAA
jgi:O-6-methylguanine DNA methyltransferase